jgi:tRNA G18 (ribose-2'-O)-methylase SpoU
MVRIGLKWQHEWDCVANHFSQSLAIRKQRRGETWAFHLAAFLFMNIIPIDDPADPRLDAYRDLRCEDVRRRGPLFIAEGRLVVRRLITSRYTTDSVLAEPDRLEELEPIVKDSTPIFVVNQTLIREVAGFNFHRGLLACGRREPFQPIETLDTIAAANDGAILALAAISLNDLENLGSLLRTSAALGIFNIVLNRQTADPLCRRVLRVSMGAALKMNFFDLADPLSWFVANRNRWNSVEGKPIAWNTIATTLAPDSIRLDEVSRALEPKMIVMGNEGDGLPPEIQNACIVRAKIPMAPGIDSLNVAVAGAIALYEFTRSHR